MWSREGATTRELSPTVEDRYLALLESIGGAADKIGPGPLTSHWPLVGADYDRGVLAVGQAVFGWVTDWATSEAMTPEGRRAILIDTQSVFADEADPMAWIAGNPVRTSPFWSTLRLVMESTQTTTSPWYSRLAWANLYPVAPNWIKANPSGPLLVAQAPEAPRLFEAIAAELDPRVVLVVGGAYWWWFAKQLDLESLPARPPPLYRVGEADGRRWVVGMHPGGASRRGWGPHRYGALIADAIRG